VHLHMCVGGGGGGVIDWVEFCCGNCKMIIIIVVMHQPYVGRGIEDYYAMPQGDELLLEEAKELLEGVKV
jgi:hypothetical protein